MTMRDVTRRKLDRIIRVQRLKRIGIGAMALVAIGAYFVCEDLDARILNVRVPATVAAITPLNVKSTRMIEDGLTVDVLLNDGRHVNVIALKTRAPHIGDHIEIIEHHHGTGRVTYSWQ